MTVARWNQRGIGLLVVILALAATSIIAGAGYIIYSHRSNGPAQASINSFEECVAAGNPVMESYPEQCAANGQVFVNPDQQTGATVAPDEEVIDRVATDEQNRFTSGQGAFTVTFPGGWKEILKPMTSDWFLIQGMEQPNTRPDVPAEVREIGGYGSDSASVFTIMIHNDFAPPEGTATDYTLVNGGSAPITGKKYAFEREAYTGPDGQYPSVLEYTYVFELSNANELRVYYQVYESDPRNQIETVEEIIDSIALN